MDEPIAVKLRTAVSVGERFELCLDILDTEAPGVISEREYEQFKVFLERLRRTAEQQGYIGSKPSNRRRRA